MRTTIDMPDQLYRRAKAAAALRGSSLKSFITEAVASRLGQQDRPGSGQNGVRRGKRRVRLPLVPSKRPGSLNITPEIIDQVLMDEEIDALTRR